MSFQLPDVPVGSGDHPIAMVVIAAGDLAASSAFYERLFGWSLLSMSAEMSVVMRPSGPLAALRSDFPPGSPGMVPYVRVTDLDATLARLVAAGGTLERAPWSIPMVGRLARFKDPSGTVYGLTDAKVPGGCPRVPMPFGPNPRPPAGSICSVEMYAADEAAAGFFRDAFGWGTAVMMPQYTVFDAGAGVGGVFQSHTPTLPALAYLYADDVPAMLAAIAAAGGQPIGDAMPMPGAGCFGYFKDPSGTTMGLIGPA